MPKQEEIQEIQCPITTTDIIIEYLNPMKGIDGIVLIERRNPPYGIAIPGGFAEYGLSLEDNAIKEAMEETGLEIRLESPGHPFLVRSAPDRDPRGHMISVAYIAKGYGKVRKGVFDDAKDPHVYTIPEVKELIANNQMAFDHAEILKEYLIDRGYMKKEPDKKQGKQIQQCNIPCIKMKE